MSIGSFSFISLIDDGVGNDRFSIGMINKLSRLFSSVGEFIPKVINLIAAILISTILIKKWLTSEIDQKYQLNKMVDEQTSEINTISKKNLNALKQIKASEKYYKQSIENAPYPIMIHAEGEVVQLSDAWTKITGYTINDIPTISQWTAKAYGEDAIPSKEFIDNLYTIDSVQYDGEWEVTTKSGDKRIWDFSSSPNGRLSDGRKSVTSMAVDITDQKINEDKIKKQNNSPKVFSFLFTISKLLKGIFFEIKTFSVAIIWDCFIFSIDKFFKNL